MFWAYMVLAGINAYGINGDYETNQLIVFFLMFIYCMMRGFEISKENGIEL